MWHQRSTHVCVCCALSCSILECLPCFVFILPDGGCTICTFSSRLGAMGLSALMVASVLKVTGSSALMVVSMMDVSDGRTRHVVCWRRW